MLVIRIGHSKCKPGRALALIIPNGHSCTESKGKCIAYPTITMHLNDKVITVGGLLFEETCSLLGINCLDLFDTWIAWKLDEAINVMGETFNEPFGPRQSNQCDLRFRKACSQCSQRWHGYQQITKL